MTSYPLGSPAAMALEKSLDDPTYWDDDLEPCEKCGIRVSPEELNEIDLCEQCEKEWKQNLKDEEEEKEEE